MSELAEFEEPEGGDVFRLVELSPAKELQGLVDLALAGIDYTPIEQNELVEIWGTKHGFSGSWRWKSSYDPKFGMGCAVADMQSLQQETNLSWGSDPHRLNDPGFLISTPGETFSGHWLCVAWEDKAKNYLINLENGVVYEADGDEDAYHRVHDENLDQVNLDVTRVLSMMIDDAI
ncbi:MAG TPA: hypothetical protein VFI84_03270 [Candidatus Saccharimonadales bacterium]|nr:hypothetical protein [Candidatus Saccharimonadales bacterium]